MNWSALSFERTVRALRWTIAASLVLGAGLVVLSVVRGGLTLTERRALVTLAIAALAATLVSVGFRYRGTLLITNQDLGQLQPYACGLGGKSAHILFH